MARRLRVAGLLLLLTIGVTSATALPDREIFVTYYTDATLGEECGYRYTMCSGVYSSGCRTAYYTVEYGFDC